MRPEASPETMESHGRGGAVSAGAGRTELASDPRRDPVGVLVARQPAWAAVLDRMGIDYCCHGALPLDEACATSGVDVDLVVAELRTAGPAPGACPLLLGREPGAVIDHVVAVHHDYCHRELPRLRALVAKVAAVHGARHPELADVRQTFERLSDELHAHLAEEERVVFPLCRAIAGGRSEPTGAWDGNDAAAELAQRLRTLLAEHDAAGGLLVRLRELTAGFRMPADGCASYAAMLDGLHAFEADLHRHVHEENNVLFPAVLAPPARPGRD